MSRLQHNETAETLFAALAEVSPIGGEQVPPAVAYATYQHLFNLCLDQQTDGEGTHFVGPFAKTDYLLKEHGATQRLRRNTNETRVRLAQQPQLSDTEMEHHQLHDLKHLCEFFALVYSAEIPAALKALFPDDRNIETTDVLGECMRAIVDSWDDTYIICRIDNYSHSDPVRVQYAGDNDEWSYLNRMLSAGTQLNLVRPRQVGQVLMAELIIFEPDYLVDISAIARCFETYAESPYVHLLQRLQPSVSSEAILLGNFSGQLLDEALHQLPDDHRYADSVNEFFKQNALALLTTPLSPTFHAEAQQQRAHIRAAINDSLPRLVRRFAPQECIVEPSFFCEMLGLQGRMDMLQLDFRVLFEQKAGKGEYPQGDFSKPRHREQHYVQLLLYMAVLRYNFSEIYEANHRELHAFLLYSKYKESLLGLGFAPQLLYRAIKIRNGIAWADLQFAKPDGPRLLEGFTPDTLNMKQVAGPLWERYTRPSLERLLAPIHTASSLEREYYFCFLRFIASEHIFSKLGNRTKENSGFAAHWHTTLNEKLQTGDIYQRLRLVSPEAHTEGRIDQVILSFADTTEADSTNFRIADIVVLYSYPPNASPDIRRSIVFRGSIAELTATHITIQLRAPQTSPRVFLHSRNHYWAVEHDFMESTFTTMYRGMHSFLSAPKERRDLLLLQRPPRTTPGRRLKGEYGAFNSLAQRVKEADELFLIIGPPGTGKTSFGMLNTLREQLAEPDTSVLILSFTNRAVDEVCSKLVECDIDFLRIGRSYNTPEVYRPYLLEERLTTCNRLEEVGVLLRSARVVVATTSTLSSHLSLLSIHRFALAIIDEASQLLEPHLVGLLSAALPDGTPAIRKFVLIGDHKQLPAVVQSPVDETNASNSADAAMHLESIGLRNTHSSLFERLLARYGADPSVTYMLTNQGRMHPVIADFVNETFYNQRLDIVPLPHQLESLTTDHSSPLAAGINSVHDIDSLLATCRVAFIDAPLPQSPYRSSLASAGDVGPKVNLVEARLIASIVHRIYLRHASTFSTHSTVGVIVPYRTQITAIRDELQRLGVDALSAITIDTVERYQGSQRDYIIYGFTVQRRYQLNFLTANVFVDTDGTIVDRKLNVALTRAKRGMIIVGHAPLLMSDALFRRLVDYHRTRGSYFLLEGDCFVTS